MMKIKILILLGLTASFSAFGNVSRFNPSFGQYVVLGQIEGWTTQRKFGYNPDIDTGQEEDIISWGGTYKFPDAAAVLVASSSSTNDTAPANRPFSAPGKTDIRLRIIDVDSNNNQVAANLAGFLTETGAAF